MHIDVSFRQLTGDCQHHHVRRGMVFSNDVFRTCSFQLNNIIQSTLESVMDLKMFPRTGLTVRIYRVPPLSPLTATHPPLSVVDLI